VRADPERHGGTLGFIATAGASAVSVGLVVITATVLGVDTLRSGVPTGLSPALYLLFSGTLGGILAAAGTAWWLLQPIESTYRRGGLAMVSGFATVLLMLICIPVHQFLGRTGLGALIAACTVAAALLARRARRIGSNP
jgi:Na+/H+ antiporter NhaC